MSFGNTNTDILIAGAVAAFSVDLLIYPLDTIKTRIQSPDYKKLYTNTQTGAVQRTLFRGLYQGIGSVILATVPSSGAFFTTYEAVKAGLIQASTADNGKTVLPGPLIHSAASSFAECVSCLILTPAEVLKQNAQMVKKTGNESSKAFDANATMQAWRKFNKPSQLWRGYTALVARNLPFTAMQFPMFEHLKERALAYREAQGTKTGTLLEKGVITGISAGAAGTVAAVITTPIDVVKTRIMLSAGDEKTSEDTKKQIQAQGKDVEKELERAKRIQQQGRLGSVGIARQVFQQEGLKGLFRGGALRGVWTFLGSGLYLGVYESGRTYLESRRATE